MVEIFLVTTVWLVWIYLDTHIKNHCPNSTFWGNPLLTVLSILTSWSHVIVVYSITLKARIGIMSDHSLRYAIYKAVPLRCIYSFCVYTLVDQPTFYTSWVIYDGARQYVSWMAIITKTFFFSWDFKYICIANEILLFYGSIVYYRHQTNVYLIGNVNL